MKKLTINRVAIAVLTTLTLAVTTPSVRAQRFDNNQFSNYSISPVDLVSQAYRGQFKDIGIPSYSILIQHYRRRRITAEELIKKVVEADKLPEAALTDEGYLNTVDAQLRALQSLGIFNNSR